MPLMDPTLQDQRRQFRQDIKLATRPGGIETPPHDFGYYGAGTGDTTDPLGLITTPGTTTPPPADVPGVPGAPGTSGGPVQPFNYQTPAYGGPFSPDYQFDPVPQFDAPQFQAPDAQGLYSDPGYQFRLSEGERALQNSASGRGAVRTGGTLKDILAFGQNLASQEYANTYNRALEAYDRLYQGAKDTYAPNFAEWQTKTAANQRAKDLAWQRYWDNYIFGINDEFRREQMLYGGA